MTAVEWLFQQLWETPKDKFTWHSILEQAKEMEKEQIIEAYYYDPNCNEIKDDGEEYYNETYKQD